MFKCWMITLSVLGFNAYADSNNAVADKAGLAADASESRMKMASLHTLSTSSLRSHLDGVKKKRALTDVEMKFNELLSFAELLKVEKVLSHHLGPESLDSLALKAAVTRKIYEDPEWKQTLAVTDMQKLKGFSNSLKESFDEKSYVGAWILKQNGDQAKAKTILSDLYNKGADELLKIQRLNSGENPMVGLGFIQRALIPMSTTAEQEQINGKMQKLKNHVSNLPDLMIMT